jgi:hypothetical protein
MVRKVTFILFLVSLLIAFFYFRPLLTNVKPQPALIDRMPDGDFIGKIYMLDIAKESNSMLYFNKIPFRDLFTPEFLLAQAKSYGLDFQRPAYLFANENGEWGTLIHVSDSSKIYSGIVRLKKQIDLQDTIVGQQKVFSLKKKSAYITYGKNWIFLYKGKKLLKRMYHVMYSEKGDISKIWKKFSKEKQFRYEKLVLYSNYKRLQDKGITTAIFAHDTDTTSLKLKVYLRSQVALSVSPKKEGVAFKNYYYTGRLMNIHMNVEKLRKSKNDPFYKIISGLSSRVSFPLQSFLNAWEGDISYHQGGSITVKEKVIESVLDENFNVSQVETLKEKKVPGFALLLSVNKNINDLLYHLFVKGILRKEGDKMRFLFSPAIKMKLTPDVAYFYSSDNVPMTELSSYNGGVWTHNYTKFGFQLDSMKTNEIFGSVNIPVERIIRYVKGWI